MADRERVLKALQVCYPGCVNWCQSRVKGMCEYDGHYCMMQLHKDALELLKAQEPRVLSREEIINANGYIWKEYSSMWAMTAVLIEYGMERIPYKGDYSTLELDWRSYGKTWRCWNVCPTEEQREAAAWEERRNGR